MESATFTRNSEINERLNQLTQADLDKVVETFKNKLDHEYTAYLNACVHCGLCADSCHYYLANQEFESIPAYKLALVTKVFKKYFTLGGKWLPSLSGAKSFDRKMAEAWVDSLFGRCSLCGRCSINCTIGINIPYLIRIARSALQSVRLVPPGLQSTVDTAMAKGNNMGIPREGWLDTVQWIEEELRDELQDASAVLPIDQANAIHFYTVNPREPMFFPLSIQAIGKIFHAAKESWTMSSENFDLTNYGLYNGDDAAAGEMSDRLVRALKKLGCKTLVLGECGHGFNSNRWEANQWLKKEYDFEVKSILQLVAGYIRDGRITLDPAKNKKTVTLHDPCNLVRLGGIMEDQRYILRHAVSDFVEMTPNREKNFCCGGGGGQLAMTCFSDRRVNAGRIKAEQIRATGARIVATPCHNCVDQLGELNKHYKLGVEIKTVCELVADAMVP